jgi:hypothetical protein
MYKDYMTYCHPAWVSTWGWNKIYPVIRDISMWSAADATVPSNSYGGAVLVGTINADGSEIWHTVPGAVRPERITDQTQVEFSVAGEVVAVHGTQVTELQDAAGHMIVAPLPTGFDAVDGIALRRGGTARPLDKSTMRLRHHFVAAQ